MTSPLHIPDSEPKAFALEVVRRLRDAGFEAVWAGGCVRDALLGTEPSDYDVATSARPDDVIGLFGKKRSVAVGASFGVVIVLGDRRSQGQVEVAAFRTDGTYSDGRRPDSVKFCSAEEDALRRDFTINGMFYDPVSEEVVDYVGGRQDLQAGIVRAIGNADERFTEDKLRMLRAARFAARLEFTLDETTAAAIRRRADDIRQVSAERIAQELRSMLKHSSRQTAMNLLVETQLFPAVFPMVTDSAAETAFRTLPFLQEPVFEPSLSVLLQDQLDERAASRRDRTARITAACRSFRLSNDETATVGWLCEAFCRSRDPEQLPLHQLKPLLADDRRELLLDRVQASVRAGLRPAADQTFLQTWLARTPPESLNPPPLITGTDLKALGIKTGPVFSRILKQVRDEQLDELIATQEQALQRVRELA